MTLSTAKTHRGALHFRLRVLSYCCGTLLTLQLHKTREACKIGRQKAMQVLRSATRCSVPEFTRAARRLGRELQTSRDEIRGQARRELA